MKTWKRGDKLKIEDLNRFEDGLGKISAETTVNNNENAASTGVGKCVIHCTLTMTSDTEFTIDTVDKTATQIDEAYDRDDMIMLKGTAALGNDTAYFLLPLTQIYAHDDSKTYSFSGATTEDVMCNVVLGATEQNELEFVSGAVVDLTNS